MAEHPRRADGEHPHIGRVLDGRYHVLGSIGVGASAEVFLADDRQLGRQVAVKILHPGLAATEAFRRRFEAEARAAASLNHPNLLAVYDWSDTSDVFLVTELLAGGSLRAILDRGPNLSPSQALMIGLDAANGLAHAHAAGFVHRDVKPANLMFRKDGRLSIADFGIARAVAEAAWTEPDGALIGTARYAAPEQAVGRAVDERADVYSMALTLIEAVTGEVPLLAENAIGTMVRRQDHDVELSTEHVQQLSAIGPVLLAAGRADPSARPTAHQLALGLQDAARSLPRPQPIELVALQAIAQPSEGGRLLSQAPEAASIKPDAGDGRAATARPKREAPRSDTHDSDTPETPDGGAPDHGLIGNDLRSAEAHVRGPHDITQNLATTTSQRDDTTPMPRPLAPDTVPVASNASNASALDASRAVTTAATADPPAEDPPRRRLRPILFGLGLIAVLIGGGLAAFGVLDRATGEDGDGSTIVSLPTLPVGTYVGKTVDEVQNDIDISGWSTRITTVREDGTIAGEILTQSPQPGFQLTDGGIILLVVSDGPRLRTVTDLVGLTLDEATTNLEAIGLELGEIQREFDEELADGVVISQAVDIGEQLETGTAVNLVLSAGPEPRTLPILAGRTPAEAEATLTALGLVVELVEEHSQTVPEGIVIRSTPDVDAIVERDSTVQLVVSLGLPFIEVPDVTGLRAAAAADVLTEAGFVVADTEGPPNREVLATDPPAGETRRQGTEIIIFTRR